jgi:aldose sugar dehydrogenase
MWYSKQTYRICRSIAACAIPVALVTAGPAAADVAVERTVIEDSVESERTSYRVARVVSGLEHPWGFDWLPDGRMIITERPGRMHLVTGDSVTELSGLPQILSRNQGGLLDVKVHPDYEENGFIYFVYSSPGDSDAVLGDAEHGTATTLARAQLSDDGSELIALETIYAQAPRRDPGRHYGSRILFPGDGTVVFSIGDRGLRFPAQDLTDPAGSVIRLNEDGGAVEDNPFVGKEPGNLRPEIYSFGHRNIQGMAIHPQNGEIWASDHGPLGGDLLYRIEAGENYGWPQVARGREYSTGEFIGIGMSAPGVREPEYSWEESKAPSGLIFYDGEAFPEWEGHLFAGFLLTKELIRLELTEDGEVTHEETLLGDMVGRIRDVRQGPDGMLYVATDESDGGIYRIEPVDAVMAGHEDADD